MSERRNKNYSRQFKEEAMDLVRVRGYDAARAARDLGVPTTTLNLWLKKAGWVRPPGHGEAGDTQAPPSEDPRRLRARVGELERQVKRLEMEKEILKKSERNGRLPANATAFFASQSG